MKIEQIYKKLGKLIAERRTELLMSHAELAKKIRLSRSSVVNIEAGRQRISLHHLFAAEKALGYPCGYFVAKTCLVPIHRHEAHVDR